MAMKVETIANVGWPDVVFVPPPTGDAYVVWIEFKVDDKPLTLIQEYIQKELVKRGQRVYTVRTREQFRQYVH